MHVRGDVASTVARLHTVAADVDPAPRLHDVSASGAGLLAGYAAAMLGVCLLATIAPVRRALRMDPTEALRGEG